MALGGITSLSIMLLPTQTDYNTSVPSRCQADSATFHFIQELTCKQTYQQSLQLRLLLLFLCMELFIV